MDHEQRSEGRIFILDIKGNCFSMELLKIRVTCVVDKHKLASLFNVNKYMTRMKDELISPRE